MAVRRRLLTLINGQKLLQYSSPECYVSDQSLRIWGAPDIRDVSYFSDVRIRYFAFAECPTWQ